MSKSSSFMGSWCFEILFIGIDRWAKVFQYLRCLRCSAVMSYMYVDNVKNMNQMLSRFSRAPSSSYTEHFLWTNYILHIDYAIYEHSDWFSLMVSSIAWAWFRGWGRGGRVLFPKPRLTLRHWFLILLIGNRTRKCFQFEHFFDWDTIFRKILGGRHQLLFARTKWLRLAHSYPAFLA